MRYFSFTIPAGIYTWTWNCSRKSLKSNVILPNRTVHRNLQNHKCAKLILKIIIGWFENSISNESVKCIVCLMSCGFFIQWFGCKTAYRTANTKCQVRHPLGSNEFYPPARRSWGPTGTIKFANAKDSDIPRTCHAGHFFVPLLSTTCTVITQISQSAIKNLHILFYNRENNYDFNCVSFFMIDCQIT